MIFDRKTDGQKREKQQFYNKKKHLTLKLESKICVRKKFCLLQKFLGKAVLLCFKPN